MFSINDCVDVRFESVSNERERESSKNKPGPRIKEKEDVGKGRKRLIIEEGNTRELEEKLFAMSSLTGACASWRIS